MDKYRYGDKRLLVMVSISLFATAIFGGLIIYALRFITDYAVAGDLSKLFEISKILLIVLIFELIFNLLSSYLKSLYLNKSMIDLRSAYVKKLFDLDIKNIAENDEEKYLSHLSNDMDRYETGFYLNLLELVEVFFHLIVSMFILARISNTLLFLAMGLLIFFILISKKTSKPIEDKEKVKSESLEKYTNFVNETLKGFYVIKQNSLENSRINRFESLAKKVQDDNYEVDKKSTHVDALNSFIQMTIIFTLVTMGVYYAKQSGLSLGMTMLAGTAFANSIGPMQRVTPYISQMTGISIVLKDFEKALSKENINAKEDIKEIRDISFRSTDLGYKDKTVLQDVNIDIKKGQKTLIVGTSGAGKSTILKSLRRQLPLRAGEILIDNNNLKDISADTYFGQLSVVDQIGFIFNGSLKENISLYKDESEDKLNDILMQVGLEDLRLDYKLKNNGSNLSGGQRARLLLARALYLDTSLIICDEIFASLDQKIGQSIERQMLKVDKTLINVSHIIYENNIDLYDLIYLVKDKRVFKIDNFQEIKDLDLFLN